MRTPNVPSTRSRSARLAVVLLLLLAPACGAPAPQGSGSPASPARVVALSPALTETVFALGFGASVVGVTDYCDYPPEARAKPKVGGYASPSVEAILALEPDLVLVSPGPGNRDAALALRRAGVRVEVVPAETLAESLTAIEAVARLLGAPERGSALAGSVRARLDAVAARAGRAPRISALFCVQIDPIIVAGAGTLPAELLEIAGGRNVIPAPRYPRIGIETVIESAPEVILQARMDVAGAAEARREEEFWSRWPAIPAVRTGHVVVLDAPLALRPGPRVGEAAEQLEGVLHARPARAVAAGAP